MADVRCSRSNPLHDWPKAAAVLCNEGAAADAGERGQPVPADFRAGHAPPQLVPRRLEFFQSPPRAWVGTLQTYAPTRLLLQLILVESGEALARSATFSANSTVHHGVRCPHPIKVTHAGRTRGDQLQGEVARVG